MVIPARDVVFPKSSWYGILGRSYDSLGEVVYFLGQVIPLIRKLFASNLKIFLEVLPFSLFVVSSRFVFLFLAPSISVKCEDVRLVVATS